LKYFQIHKTFCPSLAPKCEFTNNIYLLKHADAVILHINGFDPLEETLTRQKWQKYIFENHEPPTKVEEELHDSLHLRYDLTMTYRKDSDIHMPYFNVARLEQPMSQQVFLNVC
jgi:hypothetical protein